MSSSSTVIETTVSDLPRATPAPLRPAPSLSVVVPCHNEETALPALFRRLETLNDGLLERGLIAAPLELVLVDDGSHDETWQVIAAAPTTLPVTGVKLSRNHGHQHALYAGLMQAGRDVVVSMDADLQDDPDAIGRCSRPTGAGPRSSMACATGATPTPGSNAALPGPITPCSNAWAWT